MFLRTSGNSADTSLPSVIAIMVFCIDSFLHNELEKLSSGEVVVLPFVGILRAVQGVNTCAKG